MNKKDIVADIKTLVGIYRDINEAADIPFSSCLEQHLNEDKDFQCPSCLEIAEPVPTQDISKKRQSATNRENGFPLKLESGISNGGV
jgi:hypothetical protein